MATRLPGAAVRCRYSMANCDIIVIGASAGGVAALRQLSHSLSPKLRAGLLVVLHIGGWSNLAAILSNGVPALEAVDGEPIKHGRIYVARPDFHMLIENGVIRLSHGPKENRHRPSIDVLFRSAAAEYGERVAGIVLSGALNDGTAGLAAIKEAGGIAIVQDPRDAEFPDMPTNALNAVRIDYCVPLAKMPGLLAELSGMSNANNGGAAAGKKNKRRSETMEDPRTSGQPSVYTCPECHGTLWELRNGDLARFTCRVGHSFTLESMEAEVSNSTEAALWAAVRSLEEKTELVRRMAFESRSRKLDAVADVMESKAIKSERDAALIRKLLIEGERGAAD